MSTGIQISVVSEVFTIENRGCVVLPGLPCWPSTIPDLRRGTPITLRRPDGSEFQTSIGDVEMVSGCNEPPAFRGILIALPIAKSDIPLGTELWFFPTNIATKTGDANSAGT